MRKLIVLSLILAFGLLTSVAEAQKGFGSAVGFGTGSGGGAGVGGLPSLQSARTRCQLVARRPSDCNYGDQGAAGFFHALYNESDMLDCLQDPGTFGTPRMCWYDAMLFSAPTEKGFTWTLDQSEDEVYAGFRQGAKCIANFDSSTTPDVTGNLILGINTVDSVTYTNLVRWGINGCYWQMHMDGSDVLRADLKWTGINVSRQDNRKTNIIGLNQGYLHNATIMNESGYNSDVGFGNNGANCTVLTISHSKILAFIPIDFKIDCDNSNSGDPVGAIIHHSWIEVVPFDQMLDPSPNGAQRYFKVEFDAQVVSYNNTYVGGSIDLSGGSSGSRHSFIDDVFMGGSHGQNKWWINSSGNDDMYLYMRGAKFIYNKNDEASGLGFQINNSAALDMDLEGSFTTCNGFNRLNAFINGDAPNNFFRIDFDLPASCFGQPFNLTRDTFDAEMLTKTMDGSMRIGEYSVSWVAGVRTPAGLPAIESAGKSGALTVNAFGQRTKMLYGISNTSGTADLDTGEELCRMEARSCANAYLTNGMAVIASCATTVANGVSFAADCAMSATFGGDGEL